MKIKGTCHMEINISEKGMAVDPIKLMRDQNGMFIYTTTDISEQTYSAG
jgi:hypothetical protein